MGLPIRTKGDYMKYKSTLLSILFTLLLWVPTQAFEAKTIDIEGRAITYFDEGKGVPVVLVHGLFASKDQWLAVGKKLCAGHRVIIPDLPGYGASRIKEKSDYVLDQQVKLLDRFLDLLSPGRVHLAGNSMGGSIAALFTRDHPEKVISLSFVGAPGGVSSYTDELRNAIFADTNPFIPETLSSFLYELELLFVNPPVLPDEKIAAIVAGYRAKFREYQSVFTTVSINILEMQAAGEMGGIKRPTLILWGEKDRIFNISGAKKLNRMIALSELKILENTGHLPMVEEPDRVHGELVSFISKIE